MTDKNHHTILVVDDEPKICQILSDILSIKGYHVIVSHNGSDALQKIKKNTIDLILLDLVLPGMSGMELLQEITTHHVNIPVIMISAHGTIQKAVESIKQGAYDFIEKPPDAERILITIKNAIEKRTLTLKTQRLQKDEIERYQMIGKSDAIQHIFRQIESLAPSNSSVFITGESGTGKELVARALHNLSNRFGCPYVVINCAAIPDNLIESELFGYEKGAFTGATTTKRGRVELAHSGTLFLDEIGDLRLELQAKILRLVENQEFERLGSLKTMKIDFRLIAASNKNLKKEMENGNFRKDLYYRLSIANIHLPPLRERKEDIRLLSDYFLKNYCEENNIPLKHVDETILSNLGKRDWPGNVRELKNMIENMAVLSGAKNKIQLIETIDEKIRDEKFNLPGLGPLKNARERFDREYIRKVLKATNWNISEAAKTLGVDRTHLHKKIKLLDIKK